MKYKRSLCELVDRWSYDPYTLVVSIFDMCIVYQNDITEMYNK